MWTYKVFECTDGSPIFLSCRVRTKPRI